MSTIGILCRAVPLLLACSAPGCSQTVEQPSQTPTAMADERAAAAQELLELGLEFASRGDAIRGEQYLVAALDAGADPNRALLPLLRLCIKSSRLEAAAQYGEVYGREVRAKRDLDLLLGGLYVTLEQSEKAVKHLQRVALRYPEYAMAHLLLARLLHREARDLEQADEHFRAYLRLAPEGPYATEARESLLKRLDETEQLPELPREGTL